VTRCRCVPRRARGLYFIFFLYHLNKFYKIYETIFLLNFYFLERIESNGRGFSRRTSSDGDETNVARGETVGDDFDFADFADFIDGFRSTTRIGWTGERTPWP
jgi:hypothetical protein